MASISRVTDIGRALAKGFIGLDDIFVAVGTGDPEWGEEKTDTFTFASNTLEVDDNNIQNVVVKSSDEVVTYVVDDDYTVDEETGIITRNVSGDIANNATVSVTWEKSFEVLLTETDLEDEIGRKRASVVDFVVADEEGSILTEGGRYSLSETPTRTVLIQVTFLVDEATGSSIREFGVFANTVLDGSVGEGVNYVEPADVDEKGILCIKQKNVAIDKDTVGELSRNFVITL